MARNTREIEGIQYCTCEVELGGDMRNTVVRGVHNPVTYPEAQVLMLLHGSVHVKDLKPLGKYSPVSKAQELERLVLKYGKRVAQLFPGSPRNPVMETEMYDVEPDDVDVDDDIAPAVVSKTPKERAMRA